MQKLIEWLLSLFKRPAPPAPTPSEWISFEEFAAATGLNQDKAQQWYPDVRAACLEFGIVGCARTAAFLAQVGHESGSFRYVREIWGPTSAQTRYEGRSDLGNVKPGDGSRFRGRGLIQITGRYNYEQASKALRVDFVNAPEWLETPAMAARSAAWWWASHGCNELADAGDFTALTRRINGGLNGLDDRRSRWDRAKGVLGC